MASRWAWQSPGHHSFVPMPDHPGTRRRVSYPSCVSTFRFLVIITIIPLRPRCQGLSTTGDSPINLQVVEFLVSHGDCVNSRVVDLNATDSPVPLYSSREHLVTNRSFLGVPLRPISSRSRPRSPRCRLTTGFRHTAQHAENSIRFSGLPFRSGGTAPPLRDQTSRPAGECQQRAEDQRSWRYRLRLARERLGEDGLRRFASPP